MTFRLNREKQTVQVMIRMYCRRFHHPQNELCEDCEALYQYAEKRVTKCPYGYSKPTCADCTTHCYKTSMREKIRRVMRYAGPRMLFRHPVLAIMHVIDRYKP